jgi:ferredoxin
LRVVIDYDRCTGHGRCFELSPEVFVDDDNGYGQVRDDELSPEHEPAVRRAIASCPERAISIEG